MHRRLRASTAHAGKMQKPTILFGLALFVTAAAVARSPDLTTLVLAYLTELLKRVEFYAHLELLTMRTQEELFQNLSGQLLPKGEWTPLDIRSRPAPFGARFRLILMIAATDVSVIIPTWNEEKYLPKCLNSLASQSHGPRYEIIVVDGGSTDKTVSIAEEHADAVIVNDGQRVGASRNAGAKAASGEILAFIDADTVASQGWADGISQALRSARDAVGVTGPTLPYEGSKFDEVMYHVATGWAQRFSLKLGRPHVAGFNCAYRKDAFWKAGGFEETRELSEDVLLSMRIRHEGRILFNPTMLAYTSLRRIKQHGYPYLTIYYVINAITMALFDRNLAYPKVR